MQEYNKMVSASYNLQPRIFFNLTEGRYICIQDYEIFAIAYYDHTSPFYLVDDKDFIIISHWASIELDITLI